jgi:hypothetical protein
LRVAASRAVIPLLVRCRGSAPACSRSLVTAVWPWRAETKRAFCCWQVDLGALLQQEGHDLEVVVLRCHVERAHALIASQVDLGPVLQQRSHSLDLASA